MSDLPSIEQVAATIQATRAKTAPQQAAIQGVSDSAPQSAPEPAAEVGSPSVGTHESTEQSAEVVESAPEPVKHEPKDLASSKFAALSRREKEAKRKVQEAEQRASQLEKQAQESARRAEEYEQRLSKYANIRKDPLAVLREEGIGAQDLMNLTLGIKEEKPIDPIDEKLNPLRADLERLSKEDLAEVKQELARLRQRDMDNALREVNLNIRETAKTGNYEYINAMGNDGYDLVREVMTLHYNEFKSLLTYDEACAKVEEYYEKTLEPVLKTSKVQSKFGPKPTVQAPTSKPIPSKEAKSPTTLTNSLSSASKAISVDTLSRNEALDYLAKKYNL